MTRKSLCCIMVVEPGTRREPESKPKGRREMALKKFQAGQEVVVERGQNKGLEGTVLGMNPIDGTVEVDVDGTSFFLANGVVNFKEKARTTYNAETGEKELIAQVTPKRKENKQPKSMVEMVDAKQLRELGVPNEIVWERAGFSLGEIDRMRAMELARELTAGASEPG